MSGDNFMERIDYENIHGSAENILGPTNAAWIHLISDLFERIKNYCDENESDYPEIIQIKEKFGELRIYVRTDDDTVKHWISNTTTQADHSCSRCGNAATMQRFDGAYLILCCSCAHEMASERHPNRQRLFGDRKYPVRDQNTCHTCGYHGQIDRSDDRNRCPECVKNDW